LDGLEKLLLTHTNNLITTLPIILSFISILAPYLSFQAGDVAVQVVDLPLESPHLLPLLVGRSFDLLQGAKLLLGLLSAHLVLRQLLILAGYSDRGTLVDSLLLLRVFGTRRALPLHDGRLGEGSVAHVQLERVHVLFVEV
jgi:hypothetical protein